MGEKEPYLSHMKQYGLLLSFLSITLFLQYSLTHDQISSIINRDCPTCDIEEVDDLFTFSPKENQFYFMFFPGDPDFIADVIWLKTAYYYGMVGSSGTGDYFYLPMLLDTITDLAPPWDFPYFLAALFFCLKQAIRLKGFSLLKRE